MSSSSTSRLGLNKPNPGTGEPFSLAQWNASLDKLDDAVGAKPVTAGNRPTSPWHGQFIRETDTRKLFIYNATQSEWDEIILDGGLLVARSAATGSPVASATTTETLIQATPSKVFKASRAFEARFRSQVNASAVLDVTPRLRKGANTSGTLIGDYGRINIPVASNDRFFDWSAIFITGGSDVTTQLAFTALTSAGTLQFRGFGSGPLEVRVTMIGRASDYGTAPILS